MNSVYAVTLPSQLMNYFGILISDQLTPRALEDYSLMCYWIYKNVKYLKAVTLMATNIEATSYLLELNDYFHMVHSLNQSVY